MPHSYIDYKVIKGKNFITWLPWEEDDPMDDNGHGTRVAGVAAAETNNGEFIAGVSWGSRFLAIKAGNAYGHCPKNKVADAITYAADRGAKIINLSLSYAKPSNKQKEAIDYATSEKGCLVIAAAGNEKCSKLRYPAAYDNVIAVGATNKNDERWDHNGSDCTEDAGSNFGTWVNIAAPGANIQTIDMNNSDASRFGTSLAAPFVSGAAAVVWSQHIEWSADNVKKRLEESAKKLSDDQQFGAGRIDLFEAIFFEIPSKTITIDGFSDDWSGVSPFLNDFQEDSSCGIGTDIKSVYLARDTNYLYWRMDTWSGNFEFAGGPFGKGPGVVFYSISEGGEILRGIEASMLGTSEQGSIATLEQGSNWVHWGSGPEYGRVNQVAEGKIPLTLFGPYNIFNYLLAWYHTGYTNDLCDDVSINKQLW